MAMDSIPLSRFLDVTGDGTGVVNANGDYSSVATVRQIVAQAGEFIRIDRILITIQDGTGMRAERYGSLAAALTNGIRVRVKNAADEIFFELTDHSAMPLTTNAGWGSFCFDTDVKTWGAGDEFLAVRWSFNKFKVVELDPGEKLVIDLSDNFTGIVTHCFLVQGEIFAGRGARSAIPAA